MNIKLSNIWEYLRSSLWFIPIIMTVLSIAMAFGMLHADEVLENKKFLRSIWFYAGGAENARAILSTIANSMITVAGVVFSITIVALSLSSTQFGPRLLRTFMKDTSTQLVLGSFVASYIYCLVVLRNVMTQDDSNFVPNLSIAVALALTITNIIVLIYFIHHVSTSIQADSVVHRVSVELNDSLNKLFPEELGQGDHGISLKEEEFKLAEYPMSTTVCHSKNGYIQAIDHENLWEKIKKADLLVELDSRPGDYVVKDTTLVVIHSRVTVPKELKKSIADSFLLGYYRTSEQDVEFSIDQLTEIALRALSPSLNDPFTAISCINRLCSAMCILAGRVFPSPYRWDDDGVLRVISKRTVDFESLFEASFNKIRENARENTPVLTRLAWAMNVLYKHSRTREQREIILQHSDLLYNSAMDSIVEPEDRIALLAHYSELRKA